MPWEIFVLGVAVLSIVNLFLALVVRNDDLDQVITIMDVFLILIFLIDFLRRMHVATDDRAYLLQGKGWLDLISIVPMLRIARLLRILRVSRLLGRMGGPLPAVRLFFKDRASGGLLLVLLLAIVVMEFGSIAVLWAERAAPNANITTADDALWYSIVTMSTVGYGDQYPVTDLGRLIGTGIIILGRGRLRHPHGLPGERLPGTCRRATRRTPRRSPWIARKASPGHPRRGSPAEPAEALTAAPAAGA